MWNIQYSAIDIIVTKLQAREVWNEYDLVVMAMKMKAYWQRRK